MLYAVRRQAPAGSGTHWPHACRGLAPPAGRWLEDRKGSAAAWRGGPGSGALPNQSKYQLRLFAELDGNHLAINIYQRHVNACLQVGQVYAAHVVVGSLEGSGSGVNGH